MPLASHPGAAANSTKHKDLETAFRKFIEDNMNKDNKFQTEKSLNNSK